MTRDTFQNPRFVALIAAMGLGSVMFDNTSVTTAIPSIQKALLTETSSLQWILSAMSITTGAILPFAGAFGDKWGVVKAFRIGLFAFGIGAIFSSQASSFQWLLACRVFQGLGVAFMMPNAGAVLSDNVDPRFRNKAVGLWISLSSLGLILGPTLGGYLIQHHGWHAVFWFNPIVSLIGLTLTFRLREGVRTRNLQPLDVRGILSLSLGTLLFSAGIIDAGRAHPHLIPDFIVALTGLWFYRLFYRTEKTVEHPLIEPAWFKSRRVRGVLIACAIYNATIPASTLLLALLTQQSMHLSPQMGGLVILLLCVLTPVGARVTGRVTSARALRRTMLTAAFCLACNHLIIGILAQTSIPILLATLVTVGLFFGMLFGGDTIAIMQSLEPAKAASGLAALSMVRQVAAVLGIAVFGTISEIAGKLTHSVIHGQMLGVAACGLFGFTAWFTLRDALSLDQKV